MEMKDRWVTEGKLWGSNMFTMLVEVQLMHGSVFRGEKALLLVEIQSSARASF